MKLLRPKTQRRFAQLRYVVLVRPRTIMPVGGYEAIAWFSSRDAAIAFASSRRDNRDVYVCKLVLANGLGGPVT